MNKFYCQACKLQFEAEGTKKATCPTCKTECDEYRPVSAGKNFDELIESFKKQQGGGCCGGGCCGGGYCG